MKLLRVLIVGVLVFAASCISSEKSCTYHKKYLRTNIDTTKEYNVKGTYCVCSIKDTVLTDEDSSIVKFSLFVRMNGRIVEDGIICFLGNDTMCVIPDGATSQKKIKAGDYVINAGGTWNMPVRTKKLTIGKNKQIEINFYLGDRQDF